MHGDLLSTLGPVLGPGGLINDPELCAAAGRDWRGAYAGPVLAIARPSSVQQAAAVVNWARAHKVALVPQGGNSSLAGGAVPNAEGPPALILSATRLRQMRLLDRDQRLLIAETGLLLGELQRQVAPLTMPIDLGGRDSAQLGGLLACHAGGLNVVRYGSLRAQVRGLEAVLPNGEIWHGLSQVKKDNTGLDLKSLLIGSEGTLGFITAACLQLHPSIEQRLTCLIGLETPAQALDLFWRLEQDFQGAICAAELMPRLGMARALEQGQAKTNPFGANLPAYAMVLEIALRPALASAEQDLALQHLAHASGDVLVSQSQAQAQAFWDLREGLVLAQSAYGPSVKHDVCVPLAKVPDLLTHGTKRAQAILPGCQPVPFGHLGDGSFHFNVTCPPGWSPDQARAEALPLTKAIHDLVHDLGGSISAEHGVGQARREEVARLRDPAAHRAMRTIKAALDPEGLFNPGKVY